MRKIKSLIKGIKTSDGAGVSLRRMIGSPELNMLDPFLLLDEFGSNNPDDYIGGFPPHPHRGFETITYMLNGKFRHKDTAGNEGYLTDGSVQWMTAGSGLQHSEMFPLVNQDKPNRLDLFQIWINLPAKDKMTDPGYEMIWAHEVPHIQLESGDVRIISGSWNEHVAPAAPSASWANNPDNEVALYILTVKAGGSVELPIASAEANRMLYHISGGVATVESHKLKPTYGMELHANLPTVL